MAKAALHHQQPNYSSWSMRGWLLTRMSGLEFDEIDTVSPDDPAARAEMLLLSSSILVPCLSHEGADGVGHAGDRRIPERALRRDAG